MPEPVADRTESEPRKLHLVTGLAPTRRPRPNTKEGWMAIERRPYTKAEPSLSPEELKRLSKRERLERNARRVSHLETMPPIPVPGFKEGLRQLQLIATANHPVIAGGHDCDVDSPVGAVIDGPARCGKTWLLKTFCRMWAEARRELFPFELTDAGADYLPSVYLICDTDPTPTTIYRAGLEFFHHPYDRRASRDALRPPFCDALIEHGAEIVGIDEIQFMKSTRENDRLLNESLKHGQDTTGCTFIFAGVDALTSGLFSDRSRHQSSPSQMGSRLVPIKLGPYPLDPEDERSLREWVAMLKLLERQVILDKSHPGFLARDLSGYIHARTRGLIGFVIHLVREGMLVAIETGHETITEEILETVILPRDAPNGGRPFGAGRTN